MQNNLAHYKRYPPQKTSPEKVIKSQHDKTVTVLTSWLSIQNESCMEKEKPILELNRVVHVPSQDSVVNNYHIIENQNFMAGKLRTFFDVSN